MPHNQSITVELEEDQALLDRHLEIGGYESPSEVLRAGLHALEREQAAIDEMMRRKIQESLDDPRPDIPAEDVFRELRARHAERRGKAMDAL